MTARPKDTQYIGGLGYLAMGFWDNKSPRSTGLNTVTYLSLMNVIGFLSPWKLNWLVHDASQQEDNRGTEQGGTYLSQTAAISAHSTNYLLGQAAWPALEGTGNGKDTQGAIFEVISASCCCYVLQLGSEHKSFKN